MDSEEQIACLRLIRTPNIGPMTFSLLLQRYGSAAEALRAAPDLARQGGRTLKPATRAISEAKLAANESAGARLLFKGGHDYPARLGQFDDAPPGPCSTKQSSEIPLSNRYQSHVDLMPD